MPRELSTLTATIAERHNAARIAALRFLGSFDLPNSFADAVALGLGEKPLRWSGTALREPVARNIAAKIEQVAD
jgi:hypothetical protein